MDKSIEELSSSLSQLSAQYSDIYLRKFKKFDKQMWAALHIGFAGALKEVGYFDDDVQKVLQSAKKKISQYQND